MLLACSRGRQQPDDRTRTTGALSLARAAAAHFVPETLSWFTAMQQRVVVVPQEPSPTIVQCSVCRTSYVRDTMATYKIVRCPQDAHWLCARCAWMLMGRFAVAPVHPSLQAWVPTTPDLACPLCRVRGGTARKDEDHEPFPLDTFRPPFLSFSQFLALERACRATTVVAEDEGDYRQFQDNTS